MSIKSILVSFTYVLRSTRKDSSALPISRVFFFSYVYACDKPVISAAKEKEILRRKRGNDNVLLQSRVHLSVVHFTSALPRRCKRSVFPQVFDKFAEFYGSIYGNRQRCSRRCSTCQITRMPISLIGCSYAEEWSAPSNATPVGDTFALTTSNYIFLLPRSYDDTSMILISFLLIFFSLI